MDTKLTPGPGTFCPSFSTLAWEIGSWCPLGVPCRYCGSPDTRIEIKLKPKKIGTYSIAGAAMKFIAGPWPYAICSGCGHVSEGKK